MQFDPSEGAASPEESELPRLSQPAVLLLLALALCGLLLSWSRIEGYQLADSVEYMERAQSFARGEPQDPAGGVRSFAFSLLLSPFFWLQDLFGIESERLAVSCVRGLQILFGLALVFACTRLGARLAGRGAGLVAGLVVACNPIFLQFGVSPVSGVASGLCVALGLDALIQAGSRRRALVGGVWLGAGFLMAYQTILVAAPILLLVALRGRWRGRRESAAMFAGFGLCVLFQVVLDRVTWGEWGISLGNYVLANGSSIVVRVIHELGFSDTAQQLYDRAAALQGYEPEGSGSGEPRQVQPMLFYVHEIWSMLVLPVLGLLALGVARSLRRPNWGTSILMLTLGLNVFVMSIKGAKSFRLWLPLLPLIAPLCGVGCAWLWGALAARSPRVGRAVVPLVLLAGLVLGLRTLFTIDVRQYGVYWDAMNRVNELAAPGERVASAYHWAVYARGRPDIELSKLPYHLDNWIKFDEGQRAVTLERLSEMEWFVGHFPVLEQDRALFDLVNERFTVEDVLWDEEAHATLGPVFVLRARREDAPVRRFTERQPREDLELYRRRYGLDRGLPKPVDFAGKLPVGDDYAVRVTLLGFEYETLPGSGIGWITYHWTADGELPFDYTVVDRLTSPDGAHAWQNNHGFGYGFRPSSEWVPGEILRESYPVLLGERPFSDEFRPLGGPYRRGELVPLELWMTIGEFDLEGTYHGSLRPTASGAERPLDLSRPLLLPGERRQSAEGYLFSLDNLVRLSGWLAPFQERHRWPDDGRDDPP